MANKTLFQTIAGKLLPKTDTFNEAGGKAYKLQPQQALAQYAATGCMNSTFYASAQMQLQSVLDLANQVDAEFVARTALYARQVGFMKDLPALLTAQLSVQSPGLMAEVFDRVIDSPKMLRNIVQIMRSGAVGRKSLGSLPKRMVLQWIENRSDEQLFFGSVGNDPSLADIIKMVHPKPTNARREALFGYLIGRPHDAQALPSIVKQFEVYKKADDRREFDLPDVPFQMLTAMNLASWEWKSIARNASWQMTRMNLNTFERHGVFEDKQMVNLIAERLRDPKLISKARVFPYQLMAAYMNASAQLDGQIREALQDAMEIAVANVPEIQGQVYVFPDISGSMHSPITGHRRGSTTTMRCVDVAGLISASILRKNKLAKIVPFETKVVDPAKVKLNPRDSIMTNAHKLASLPSGGTNCSAPLAYVNSINAKGDLIIYVSDNESWIDSPGYGSFGGSATQTLKQWSIFKKRNPQAKMVCINIQPYATAQVVERDDIINVAGFSDHVFSLIAAVADGKAKANHWVDQIQAMTI
jgi:60 kDa SS-A/Ro ribonucleoprotein